MRKLATTALFAAIFLLFAVPDTSWAQQDVSGTVTDAADGQPIPGVNIVVQGTTTGTTTNIDGEYSLAVPGPDATLVFSFVGYQSQSVEVGNRSTINVQLSEDVAALDEVVVVGYGTQRRRDIAGSVSSVDVEEANIGQVESPQDLIQGRVAGVNLIQNSGEPGAGVSMRIRGTSSISAGNEPLYVIDGVPISSTNITPGGSSAGGVTASSTGNPLALLNPQDIESIQILKDAAATAIYGSQGANGVVLITTKGGQSGSVQVDYSGQVAVGTFANQLNLLSPGEYRTAVRDLLGEGSVNPDLDASTDWQDATTETTIAQTHNLSFAGGNDATTYRASLGYFTQPGLLRNSGIERVNGRINASHSAINDRVRFDLNLTASYFERNHAFFNQGGGFEGGAIKSMIAYDPRRPVRSSDGTFVEAFQDIRNPVGLLEQITDVTDQKRIIGNFSTSIDLIENLTANGTVGVDVGDAIRRSYIPTSSPIGGGIGIAQQSEVALSNVVAQSTLQYNNSTLFEDQTFDLLAGYEYKRETYQTVGVGSQNFVTDLLLFNSIGSGTNIQTPSSDKQAVTQLSFFGRLNYNYNDKYLLTSTLRRDGSSVFGENQKFAWFPSASLAWRISNESFMESVSWVNDLKLRVSYGISGTQAVPPYQTLATLALDPGFRSIFGTGEQVTTGVAPARGANPDLKWEESEEINIGVDFLLGRFDGSVDVYRRETSDLLFDVRVPPPAFSTFVLQNVGSMLNRGIEFTLNALVFDRDDWSLSMGGNISSNYNEIQSLGGRGAVDHTAVSGAGQTGVFAQRLEPGHPVGAFYGPKFVGIGRVTEDGQTFVPATENDPGSEVYEGPDGTFVTETGAAVDQHIGNPVPDFSYGLNTSFQYGNFDASVFLRGAYGQQIFNNTALEYQTKSLLGSANLLEDALTDGTSLSHVPAFSSRWIQDASFLRLDKLTLGYNVPTGLDIVRRARIYFTGQNLFVFTPYDGFDPELNTNVTGQDLGFRTLARPTRGVDYTSYPRSRTYTVGVQLGF